GRDMRGLRGGAVVRQLREAPVLGLPQVNFGWTLRRYAFVRVRASGKGLSHDLFGPSLDSGNSLCYRTEPFRGGIFGRIAQLVEQLTLNQRVPGSSPGAPTKYINKIKAIGRKLN